MNKRDATEQFCKMAGEMALKLNLKSHCVCDRNSSPRAQVPDEVIAKMWEAVYAYTRKK